MTNPQKNTLLLGGDIIYVLGDITHIRNDRMKAEQKLIQAKKKLNKEKTELDGEYLKQMDDEQLLGLIKKEMEKCENERKKLMQQ